MNGENVKDPHLQSEKSGKMKACLIMAIKKLLKITAVFFIVLSFFGCNKSDDSFVNDNANKKSTGLLEYNSVAELEGKNIGVLTGSVYDDISKELIPNGNFAYFNTASDLISAMDANKIDAFAADDSFIRELLIDSPELGYINECVTETDAAIMFQKTDEGYALMTKFNQFLVKADKDGSLQELKKKWFNYDENTKMPDYENLDNSNGTVNLAVYSENSPYGFVMNGRIVGYDVELIVRFCEAYGYGLKVINTNLDGVLSSLQSGKADCGAGGINVTEERRQSVDFSLPTSKIKGFFGNR